MVRKEPHASLQRELLVARFGPHGGVHLGHLLSFLEGVGLASLGVNLPGVDAGRPAELGELAGHVEELEGTLGLLEERGDDRLVLDGVEGAGAVHEPAANLEQLRRADGDLELQRVEAVAVADAPPGPDVGSLAHGAVAGAGHVAQDGVELERPTAPGHDIREVLRLVVGHEQARGVGAFGLVRQEVAPLEIHVVGDDEAGGNLLLLLTEGPVEHLQQLERLTPGGGAHVQHPVVRGDVEEERRDHGHRLLSRDGAVLVRSFDEIVDGLQEIEAPQLLPAVVELPRESVGVPSNRPRGFNDVALLVDGLAALLHLGEELVLDLVPDVLGVLAGAVDAEGGWERGAEALHEGIPFALGDDLLALVVLLELLVVLVVRLVVAPFVGLARFALLPHVVALALLEVALEDAVVAAALALLVVRPATHLVLNESRS